MDGTLCSYDPTESSVEAMKFEWQEFASGRHLRKLFRRVSKSPANPDKLSSSSWPSNNKSLEGDSIFFIHHDNETHS